MTYDRHAQGDGADKIRRHRIQAIRNECIAALQPTALNDPVDMIEVHPAELLDIIDELNEVRGSLTLAEYHCDQVSRLLEQERSHTWNGRALAMRDIPRDTEVQIIKRNGRYYVYLVMPEGQSAVGRPSP